MSEAWEYVDCCKCGGTGGKEPDLCPYCRGDGVVIQKLNEKIKQNPERVLEAMKRIERMFP